MLVGILDIAACMYHVYRAITYHVLGDWILDIAACMYHVYRAITYHVLGDWNHIFILYMLIAYVLNLFSMVDLLRGMLVWF